MIVRGYFSMKSRIWDHYWDCSTKDDQTAFRITYWVASGLNHLSTILAFDIRFKNVLINLDSARLIRFHYSYTLYPTFLTFSLHTLQLHVLIHRGWLKIQNLFVLIFLRYLHNTAFITVFLGVIYLTWSISSHRSPRHLQ